MEEKKPSTSWGENLQQTVFVERHFKKGGIYHAANRTLKVKAACGYENGGANVGGSIFLVVGGEGGLEALDRGGCGVGPPRTERSKENSHLGRASTTASTRLLSLGLISHAPPPTHPPRHPPPSTLHQRHRAAPPPLFLFKR